MTQASEVDPARCPLCGQPNQCAMQKAQAQGLASEPCWCLKQTFDAELLARVPPAAQRRACICFACANSASAGLN